MSYSARRGFSNGSMRPTGAQRQQEMQQKLQEMQEAMNRAQEDVEAKEFTTTVGGGVVTATVNGKKVDFGNGRHVEKGTRITLTAVANEGYNFLGWYFYSEQQAETLISEKETCTFTVNRELYVFAKFAQKVMHLFNAYVAPYNGGRITENGKPVEFGNGRPVEAGAQITLTAVANEGFTFVGWYKSVGDQTEELISSDATYTFTVNERTHVYAKFDEKK